MALGQLISPGKARPPMGSQTCPVLALEPLWPPPSPLTTPPPPPQVVGTKSERKPPAGLTPTWGPLECPPQGHVTKDVNHSCARSAGMVCWLRAAALLEGPDPVKSGWVSFGESGVQTKFHRRPVIFFAGTSVFSTPVFTMIVCIAKAAV